MLFLRFLYTIFAIFLTNYYAFFIIFVIMWSLLIVCRVKMCNVQTINLYLINLYLYIINYCIIHSSASGSIFWYGKILNLILIHGLFFWVMLHTPKAFPNKVPEWRSMDDMTFWEVLIGEIYVNTGGPS